MTGSPQDADDLERAAQQWVAHMHQAAKANGIPDDLIPMWIEERHNAMVRMVIDGEPPPPPITFPTR